MKSNYLKPLLLAISYFIATATGLCGVINHSVTVSHSDLKISEIVEDSTAHVIPELAGIESFGQNDKIQLNKIQQKSRSGEYKPMLEQGKTWKYSLVDWTRIAYPTHNPGRPIERVKETRLEGYETINGETYMKLNTYCYDEDLNEYYNSPEYNNTMYYLREDTDAGKVYFYPNEDFWDYISWEDYPSQLGIYLRNCLNDQGLLYDFNAMDGHNFSHYGTIDESTVTLADGEHRCFILDEDYYGDEYRVIEGIGLTGSGKREAYIRGCSILGISLSSTFETPDSYYNSYLYEVVNADGEVIYSDENHRPGWWRDVVGITDAVAQAKVNVTADGIIITGAPDMEATLCDMQGRVLVQQPTQDGSLTISTTGLAHGVYLLRLGSKTYKIAVR